MSTLKKWLLSNQVFDKDLLKLFPKFGVNDPENDLKNLSPEQWKEIQRTITTDRAKELKDNAGKLRLQKKLTKIEKLWRQKRPKKKKKAPKLLKLFDDAPSTNNKAAASPTKKKKKKAKTPKSPANKKKAANKTPTKSDATETDDKKLPESNETNDKWDQYDSLHISDEEEKEANDNTSYKIGKLSKTESVVDALLNIDKSNNNPPETTQETKDNDDEWQQYDNLNLSDDEKEDHTDDNDGGVSLFVPLFPLKTQGSVVDMLMDVDLSGKKEKRIIPKAVLVTPPCNDTEENVKDYKMTLSFGAESKDIKSNNDGDKQDDNKTNKVLVSLSADSFVYNEANNTYSISLSGCKLMKTDFADETISFEIKGDLVHLDKSEKFEHGDDQYIDKVLDEIHENNPDTEHDD